jgi:hypothetical protein
VKATEACTVEGKVQRNIRPSSIGGVSKPDAKGRSANPTIGNSANVAAKTSRWSRQCSAPATIAARDSRAPCKKNSTAIATDVRASNTSASAPRHGSRNARMTVPAIARVNSSGRKRESVFIEAACETRGFPARNMSPNPGY